MSYEHSQHHDNCPNPKPHKPVSSKQACCTGISYFLFVPTSLQNQHCNLPHCRFYLNLPSYIRQEAEAKARAEEEANRKANSSSSSSSNSSNGSSSRRSSSSNSYSSSSRGNSSSSNRGYVEKYVDGSGNNSYMDGNGRCWDDAGNKWHIEDGDVVLGW